MQRPAPLEQPQYDPVASGGSWSAVVASARSRTEATRARSARQCFPMPNTVRCSVEVRASTRGTFRLVAAGVKCSLACGSYTQRSNRGRREGESQGRRDL